MNMEIVVDEREHARLAVEASGGQYLAKKEGTARHEAARPNAGPLPPLPRTHAQVTFLPTTVYSRM